MFDGLNLHIFRWSMIARFKKNSPRPRPAMGSPPWSGCLHGIFDGTTVVAQLTVTGWWFQPTPLKNDGVKVSWDDDIPIWKNKNHVPNHQPGYELVDSL